MKLALKFRFVFITAICLLFSVPDYVKSDRLLKNYSLSSSGGYITVEINKKSGKKIKAIGCSKEECKTLTGELIPTSKVAMHLFKGNKYTDSKFQIKIKPLEMPIVYKGTEYTHRIKRLSSSNVIIGKVTACDEFLRRGKKVVKFKVSESYTNSKRNKKVRFKVNSNSKFFTSCNDLNSNSFEIAFNRRSRRRFKLLEDTPILFNDDSEDLFPSNFPTIVPPVKLTPHDKSPVPPQPTVLVPEIEPTRTIATPQDSIPTKPVPTVIFTNTPSFNTPSFIPTRIPTVIPTQTPTSIIPTESPVLPTPLPPTLTPTFTLPPTPVATRPPVATVPPMPNMPPIKVPEGGFPVGNIVATSDQISTYSGNGGIDRGKSGAFRTYCRFSHFSYDDPIVFPGVKNATHLHMFFGNTGADAFSTIDSIRNSGGSTCDGGTLNRSAYWIPAMLDNDGVPLSSYRINLYYKNVDLRKTNKIVPIPDGLQMVAGDAKADQNSGIDPKLSHSRFFCLSNGRGYNNYSNTIREANCSPGDTLVLAIDFPQCWDGKRLTSDDQSHMSFISYDSNYPNCPSTHPVRIPDVTENVYFRVSNGGVRNWHLSSDMYNWKKHGGGYSRHADFFEGWDKDVKRQRVNNCLNPDIDCGDNVLNNGKRLSTVNNLGFSESHKQFFDSPYRQ